MDILYTHTHVYACNLNIVILLLGYFLTRLVGKRSLTVNMVKSTEPDYFTTLLGESQIGQWSVTTVLFRTVFTVKHIQ